MGGMRFSIRALLAAMAIVGIWLIGIRLGAVAMAEAGVTDSYLDFPFRDAFLGLGVYSYAWIPFLALAYAAGRRKMGAWSVVALVAVSQLVGLAITVVSPWLWLRLSLLFP